MQRNIGITAAWIGATVVAILIAAAGIGSVRSQVTESPTPLGSPNAIVVASGGDVPATGEVVSVPSTTLGSAPSSTTVTAPTATTKPGTVSVSPTTTSPQAGSSTTTTAAASSTKSYDTAGGSVRIRISGQSVTFDGAVPNPGWKVEVENAGPSEVEVKFEQNDDDGMEIEFRAKFEDGELRVTIEPH